MTALKVSIGFGEGCLWLEREGAGAVPTSPDGQRKREKRQV